MTESCQSPENDQEPRFAGDPALKGGLTDLSVRVWSIDPRDVDWSSAHVVVRLAADLLAACSGQLLQESGKTLTAQFDRPEKTVNAARRLQKTLYAFSQSEETAAFAASIVIHRPEDRIRLRPGFDASDLLWSDITVPGQILISGSAYETLQFTPGLQFRALPAGDDNPNLACHELLWADLEFLEAWQARVARASRSILQYPETNAGLPLAVQDDGSQMRSVAIEEQVGLLVSNRSGSKKQIWWAAGIVFALVAFALVLQVNSKKIKKVGGQEERKSPTTEQQLLSHADDSASSVSPPEKQIAPVEKPIVTNPVSHTRVKKHETAREPEVARAEYEGFTTKQLPQLLRRAEDDAGAGHYEEAKREYEIILKLQPGNPIAKEGLRKLSLKIGQQR